MKKLHLVVVVLIVFLVGTSNLWAGGADNKTNWSAEYVRTLNRNAATDSADIVLYNPAGVMKMDDGLYFNTSAHLLCKDYNNKINGNDFDQDEPSTVPGIFSVYRKGRWAGFFGVSNVLGGGEVDFKDGNATTNLVGSSIIQGANMQLLPALTNPPLSLAIAGQNPMNFLYSSIKFQELWAEQVGPGMTIGGAYQINNEFSFALGARYVDTTRKMKGAITVGPSQLLDPGTGTPVNGDISAKVRFKEEASGWGYVLGLNYAPSDAWNFAFRYESQVKLKFDQSIGEDNLNILPALGITDNGERKRNLPGIFGLGASCQATPELRLEANITYYANDFAHFSDIPGTPRDESAVDDGYEFGLMAEYAFSDTLVGSLGYLYTITGVDEAKDMTPELPELDSHAVGTGVAWTAAENLIFNFGIGHVFYKDECFRSTTGARITYEKEITMIGVGVQYKFM